LSIHVAVRKAENPVAALRKRFVSHAVAAAIFIEAVLVTVDLDDDSRTPALEVDDVRHERRLAAKVMAERAQFTEPLPELHLLPRHGLAQVAGVWIHHRLLPTRPP
jgi:hypothetical protein